jgi:hypothetical protein
MYLLWMSLLGTADAARPKLTGYTQTVVLTAASMPVTFALGEALTSTSNQLVPGLLPAVLTGVVLPAGVVVGASTVMANKYGYEFDSSKALGQTIGLNVGVYAGGTALGVSTNNWQDKLLYGAVSALLLPIPSWVSMNVPDTSASVLIVPSTSENWKWQASFQHRF